MRLSTVVAVVVVVGLASTAAAQFPALDASGAISFFVAKADGGEAHPDAEFACWALEAWAKASDGALEFVETENESEAVIRIYWVGPRSRKYGEALAIEVDGKPGAAVFINTSSAGLGPAVHRRAERDRLFRDTVVYLTCVHETGHAVGLSHTDDFADIMYSFQHGGNIERYFRRYRKRLKSRSQMREISPLSEGDVARLLALY
jgi:hypothetical protein